MRAQQVSKSGVYIWIQYVKEGTITTFLMSKQTFFVINFSQKSSYTSFYLFSYMSQSKKSISRLKNHVCC